MTDEWQRVLKSSITTISDLRKKFPQNNFSDLLDTVTSVFPMRINPYYASLIKEKYDPIWIQSVPDERELISGCGLEDPLNEEADSPVPHLTHRYPDRVLLLVSSQCATYCRFCTRKRKVGQNDPITPDTIQCGINYIAQHKEIRDVVISGGDPFFLNDYMINSVLKRLRKISHVEILRIHTRIPAVLPIRITDSLCKILKQYHPLYINVHFNSPIECTEEAKKACWMLADAGIPVSNQSVLLKGVNDNTEAMTQLCQKLLVMRVRPYYLYQADLVNGIDHLRTPVQTGLNLIRNLRGHTSGLAIPQFVIDAPGGGGKIPLSPNYVVGHDGTNLMLENYKKERYCYPDAK